MDQTGLLRTWDYTIVTDHGYIFDHANVRNELRVEIIASGGRIEFITDRAVLTGRAPMSAFDSLDRVHVYGGEPARLSPHMSSPYGWATQLTHGLSVETSDEVTVQLFGREGQHLVAVRVHSPRWDKTHYEYLAHLKPGQAPAGPTTHDELLALVLGNTNG